MRYTIKNISLASLISFLFLSSIFLLVLPQKTFAVSASDNFNRANGSLGSNWSNMTDGGLKISSQKVIGSNTGNSGDIRTAETYSSNQYSQIEVTSTQLSGGQWMGPVVRAQNGGQNLYTGIYYYNNGSPELMLFKRSSGVWTQLGNTINSGKLSAGTQLKLTAVGSTISFYQNGVLKISVTDTSFTGGAPGIMVFQKPTADNWTGGDIVTSFYSIGGTISGLSGSVVLQDNGGDDLTATASGGFTFPTLLSTGSLYNVTVKTDPTGQTCSVSNGVGTVGSANITNVAVTCTTAISGSVTDDFNRTDGSLGPNWTDVSDGGLAILSQQAIGTNGGNSGDIRTAESYPSNQYSQIEVGTLSGTQWIGPAVRMQNSGQSLYLGLYDYNNGSPYLQIFKRIGGTYSQLTGQLSTSQLAAGTQLKLLAVGNTIAFLVNGVEKQAVYDTSLTGGAPGIMSFGTPVGDNWAGGNAGFTVDYLSTDANGVMSYDMISANNGYGPQILRVLNPTNPAPGVAHNFIYTLPVQPGADNTTFGDGLDYLQSLNAQNQYNLTIIEPSFYIDPWYADNPVDANEQEETFMTTELQPWVKANLSTTGIEQNWLIGFSKSGIGGIDLLLKHPTLFTIGAFWDFPADMSSYSQFGADSQASYGTDANFQANYRLTSAFLDTYKSPFLTDNRIWIGSYGLYQTDMVDFDNLLTSKGIAHTTEPPTDMAHRWDSGWVPQALSALAQDSLHQ